MKKIQQLPPVKIHNFLMKTPKRSVVNGYICNQQESSSLTMAPTISKEKSTPNTIKTPVKIKKEKSQNKRIHKWKDSFLVTYKWLRKIEGKLFCVCCCKFPQYHKSMELAKWFSGNTDGFQEETFKRHAKYHVSEKHKKCHEAWDKMGLAPIVNTSIPETTQWENKSRKQWTVCKFFCRQLGVYGGHSRWNIWNHLAKL